MNTNTNLFKAYLQLFRLPNVFTAMADVLMGYLFVRGVIGQGRAVDLPSALLLDGALLFWLITASSLFYLAGMVLNDVYDLKIDTELRPHRPLPSGRIHPEVARNLGIAMLILAVLISVLLSIILTDWRTVAVGVSLALMVYLYDRVLKTTIFGPVAMGACRFFNVLLGMSAITGQWYPIHFVVAGGIGLYIVGVTWFARTEAKKSNRLHLAGATVLLLLGIFTLGSLIYWEHKPEEFQLSKEGWQLLWIILAALISWRCILAVVTPEPAMVQTAVKHSIFSLIILDAAVAVPAAGIHQAAMICLLLLPTMLLGRWIYST